MVKNSLDGSVPVFPLPMRRYVLRLRPRLRNFNLGSPEAVKCIADMQQVLFSFRIDRTAADRAIEQTLTLACDFRLAAPRQAATKERNVGAQTALDCLIRCLRDLANTTGKFPPFEKGKLYKELTAVLERSAFDTEVFIEVVDTISAILPTLSPRRRAEEALKIIHPNEDRGVVEPSVPDQLAGRRSPLIEYWELVPSETRASVERILRDRPMPFSSAWLDCVARLLDRQRPRGRPPYLLLRKFAVPVAKIWRELGLRVGSAYSDYGPVESRFQRYCNAALEVFGLTDRVSRKLIRNIKRGRMIG